MLSKSKLVDNREAAKMCPHVKVAKFLEALFTTVKNFH